MADVYTDEKVDFLLLVSFFFLNEGLLDLRQLEGKQRAMCGFNRCMNQDSCGDNIRTASTIHADCESQLLKEADLNGSYIKRIKRQVHKLIKCRVLADYMIEQKGASGKYSCSVPVFGVFHFVFLKTKQYFFQHLKFFTTNVLCIKHIKH